MLGRWAQRGFATERGERAPLDHARRNVLRSGETGSAGIKTLIWLIVFGAMVYAGIKVCPVLIAEYQFQDFMDQTARFGTVSRATAAQISKQVMDEAQQDDIPLKAEDLHVTAESGFVNIKADYSVTVDLNVYQWTLNFHPSAGNKPLT